MCFIFFNLNLATSNLLLRKEILLLNEDCEASIRLNNSYNIKFFTQSNKLMCLKSMYNILLQYYFNVFAAFWYGYPIDNAET